MAPSRPLSTGDCIWDGSYHHARTMTPVASVAQSTSVATIMAKIIMFCQRPYRRHRLDDDDSEADAAISQRCT